MPGQDRGEEPERKIEAEGKGEVGEEGTAAESEEESE